MTAKVLLGGAVLFMGLAVVLLLFLLRPKGWGFKEKKSPFPAIEGGFGKTMTVVLAPLDQVCVRAGSNRQCFGIDDLGRLGWAFSFRSSSDAIISFQELAALVRNSQEGKEA